MVSQGRRARLIVGQGFQPRLINWRLQITAPTIPDRCCRTHFTRVTRFLTAFYYI